MMHGIHFYILEKLDTLLWQQMGDLVGWLFGGGNQV
jgi:hypothetical protein